MADAALENATERPTADNDVAVIPNPEDRGTEELVIALVGPIGSGVSESARIIEHQLTTVYGYTSGGIQKASALIARYAEKVGISVDPNQPLAKTESLQNAGTKLREKFGPTVVADLAIGQISQHRPPKARANVSSSGPVPAESRRHVTIIDAVKNPAEVTRLRTVYKASFWLVGVFAPEAKRLDRLKDKFALSEDRTKAMRIDEDEGNSKGQRVAKAMEMADYFIRNSSDAKVNLENSVSRFLKIIFSVGVNTPTLDESSMYAATSAASRSACLSRQVGVVIVNDDGEIIGTGSNDVPKYGGGLYPTTKDAEVGAEDNRCYRWKNGVCHNDERKKKLTDGVADQLSFLLQAGTKERARAAIAASEVKSLIEFSRAVHAEMEAIVSVARTGGRGLVGSTLYSTTYPCHNCARHVVAAGVKRVVYIEPYAKSLAIDLHSDSISSDDKDEGTKVVFMQYEGVAPSNYLAVFRSGIARKKDGVLVVTDPRIAPPAIQEPLDDFGVREDISVAALTRILGS